MRGRFAGRGNIFYTFLLHKMKFIKETLCPGARGGSVTK